MKAQNHESQHQHPDRPLEVLLGSLSVFIRNTRKEQYIASKFSTTQLPTKQKTQTECGGIHL
jgi:hypothetical protein